MTYQANRKLHIQQSIIEYRYVFWIRERKAQIVVDDHAEMFIIVVDHLLFGKLRINQILE